MLCCIRASFYFGCHFESAIFFFDAGIWVFKTFLWATPVVSKTLYGCLLVSLNLEHWSLSQLYQSNWQIIFGEIYEIRLIVVTGGLKNSRVNKFKIITNFVNCFICYHLAVIESTYIHDYIYIKHRTWNSESNVNGRQVSSSRVRFPLGNFFFSKLILGCFGTHNNENSLVWIR